MEEKSVKTAKDAENVDVLRAGYASLLLGHAAANRNKLRRSVVSVARTTPIQWSYPAAEKDFCIPATTLGYKRFYEQSMNGTCNISSVHQVQHRRHISYFLCSIKHHSGGDLQSGEVTSSFES
ncbi:hypothetical protein GDO78_020606 [Eleutherodactylus coqui]|uniref:Uncharacterized protein n=1 Tax=Eleutherodactylus coqui TaxID=57060 RepID=A0A8J6JPC7_ELECQ|nr:hypothetical protein GDO78_020606 [Eleutherodactylus coqui]